MKTKHTPLPEIAPVPWDASGEYVYDANGKQVHLYAERQRIVRACNAHADLLAALARFAAYADQHSHTEALDEIATQARAALEEAGRGLEGGGE